MTHFHDMFVKVGGSVGTVLAWDLRRQNELFSLAGTRGSKASSLLGPATVAEGEIWEVKLDPALQGGGHGTESGKVPPVLMCSEDGILALLESGLYSLQTNSLVETSEINEKTLTIGVILQHKGTFCQELIPYDFPLNVLHTIFIISFSFVVHAWR